MNLILIKEIFTSSKLTLVEKFQFFFGYFLSLDIISWLIVILVAVNIGLLTYYIRKKRRFLKEGGVAGFFGLTFAILGSGCVACGSATLALLGFGGALVFLPFGGEELRWISVALLLVSVFLLCREVERKNVCY